MSKFKPSDFKIYSDQDFQKERVVKIEQDTGRKVNDFELPLLRGAGPGDYAAVKSKFGSFAVTDQERENLHLKDRRFSLSQLVRTHLAVEEEERRAIESRVKDRVDEISEEARKVAAQLGYQEGQKKGYEEAFQSFQSEGLERLERLESVISQMESAKEEVFRANEKFLIELIYRVSRMILLRELSTDQQFLLRLTKNLIERIGVRENINIKISPTDVESIGMLKEGLEKSFGLLQNLNIETSQQVKQGGCMIETEWNAIDASLETQLKGVYEALLGRKNEVQES